MIHRLGLSTINLIHSMSVCGCCNVVGNLFDNIYIPSISETAASATTAEPPEKPTADSNGEDDASDNKRSTLIEFIFIFPHVSRAASVVTGALVPIVHILKSRIIRNIFARAALVATSAVTGEHAVFQVAARADKVGQAKII